LLPSLSSKHGAAGGFTLIELMIVVGLIGVIAATAVPTLVRARISGNEASAIGSVRAVVIAQQDFQAFLGGFADDLATLARACPGSSVPFLSPDLRANGIVKDGYTYSVAVGAGAIAGPTDCFGNGTQSAFYATATPVRAGFTGDRAFASDGTGTIWQDSSGTPPPQPFAVGGTIGPLGR
jgi:type IV pilus assembly protein PilA